jgi:glycosyltransferase involved in cell wall biosynthesis
VALEAMGAGTPVVAHDVGNLPTLIGDGGSSRHTIRAREGSGVPPENCSPTR